MTVSAAQLREAAHLLAQMLADAKESWVERHMVWRVSR